jgi:NAD(P)-dependent dehydrogenase (short-subunit alcohol dehydrogenase family)
MHVDLTNKNILVTGASRGIGKAIAEQLIRSGATVLAQFNNTPPNFESLTDTEKGRLFSYKSDLAQTDQAVKLFEWALQEAGSVDVIINNAGIAMKSEISSSTQEFVAAWDETMAVNLRAVGILCKEAIAHFIAQQNGIIINISSRAAFRGDTAEYLAYAASKGGVVALTRSIARAYGKQGIAAFNVAPGFVKTDMADEFIEAYGEGIVKNDIALNDLTTPQDLAPLITLLASGLANHATGGTFDVNAGSYVH